MADRLSILEKGKRGSSGDLEKFLKRKRESEGAEEGGGKLEEIFRRSKKTIRSPVKMGEEGGMKELLKEMRDELREGLMGVRKEIREEQREMMRKELERLREKLRDREEKWKREKGEMMNRLKALEGELGELTVGSGEWKAVKVKGRNGDGIGNREEKEDWMERIRRLERRSEWREREERKRNIVIKWIKAGEGDIGRMLKELLRSMDEGVVIEKVRRIEAGRQERGWMGVVTLGGVEDKGKILKNKWKLKGRDIWIEEDLAWKERKMRWVLRQVVMKDGNRARMGQGGCGLKEISGNGMKKGRC
ncbi:hypothetical protein ALC57_09108 [Trachymyrmex cornetzi]|uniref:Uncharacterized protein n=1 Tax=Trachymyrmex cornetzi TaxID=471704 RepID=A0A151J5T9_9HYME|nr:hypothetical protein ALC57_09108 [Trachymyrmex cornetzi]